MSREEKLAHGAKIAKKIKTIRVADRQQALRVNCAGFYILIERKPDGGMKAVIARDLDGKHEANFWTRENAAGGESKLCKHDTVFERDVCPDCGAKLK